MLPECDITEATTSYLIVAENCLWQCLREKTALLLLLISGPPKALGGSTGGGQYLRMGREDGES